MKIHLEMMKMNMMKYWSTWKEKLIIKQVKMYYYGRKNIHVYIHNYHV